MKTHHTSILLTRSLASGSIALLFLSSCAVINPYVKPSENNFRTTPSFNNALKYAEDMREEYYDAKRDYSGFNRFVGTALIGTATAALGLGIGSGSASTISMLGLGGGALFGLNSWLNGTPKQNVYQAGIEALSCTIQVFGPFRNFNSDFLNEKLGKLDIALIQLDNELRSIKNNKKGFSAIEMPGIEEHINFAEAVLINGKSTLDNGKQAKALTEQAGVRLYDATQNIRAQVTRGLTDTEGNVVELVASLSKTIPANASLITGKPHVPSMQPATSFSSTSINSLERATIEVKSLTDIIQGIVASLTSNQSRDQLASCARIDSVESGISFKVSPSRVVIDATKTGQPAPIIISKGKPPYFARWINQIPIGLKLGSVNHDFGRSDEAVVLIEVTSDAKPGDFELNVSDSGRGSETILVSVVGAQNNDKVKPLSVPNTTKNTQSDPLTKNVQDLLISLNCLPSTINGKPSNDGILGTQTNKAITDYFTAQRILKEQQEPFFGQGGLQNLRDNLRDTLSSKEIIKCSPI